jgi:hypothetical protein
LSDSVSFRGGALIERLAVGLQAVDMARMARGATLLVIGAGPVGLAVMLFCASTKLATVTPWLALKYLTMRNSTISTTTQRCPRLLADDGQGAIGWRG